MALFMIMWWDGFNQNSALFKIKINDAFLNHGPFIGKGLEFLLHACTYVAPATEPSGYVPVVRRHAHSYVLIIKQ